MDEPSRLSKDEQRGKFPTPLLKTKKKTKRGGRKSKSKSKKCENKTVNFTILGNNCAGLKAKTKSLNQAIKAYNFPSCVTLQETKMRKMGLIKLNDYQIFEKIRPGLGGGLLTAIKETLNPVLISRISESAEILVVQCQVNEMKVRILNGYGPQDDDHIITRQDFWMTLEQEVVAAKESNCAVLIQLDANAKVGNSIISLDPNNMSENGRLLLNILERENLHLLNSSPLCTGVITRQRITKQSVEKSVIDYMITCDRLFVYLEQMSIDEEQHFSLVKYASMKGRPKVVKSDHNLLFTKFSIQYQNVIARDQRKELFNLKNVECQKMFSLVTENNHKLRKCFQSNKPFPEQCNTFF